MTATPRAGGTGPLTPGRQPADQRLKECEAKLEDYTQQVFQAVAGQ